MTGILKGPVKNSSYHKRVTITVEPLDAHKEGESKYCAVPGYSYLKPGSDQVKVMIKNLTAQVQQGSKVTSIEAANVEVSQRDLPTPIKGRYRRIPPHQYEEVRKHLIEILDIGAIRRSNSPWAKPVMLVCKKDGSLRFCIGLRKLNARTVKDELHLDWCIIYLDDIIIFSKIPGDHITRLEGVFEKLAKAGLKLKPSKCEIFHSSLKYLGHIVSKDGIATDPKRSKLLLSGLSLKQLLTFAALRGLQTITVSLLRVMLKLLVHCMSSPQETMQSEKFKRWIRTSGLMSLSKL